MAHARRAGADAPSVRRGARRSGERACARRERGSPRDARARARLECRARRARRGVNPRRGKADADGGVAHEARAPRGRPRRCGRCPLRPRARDGRRHEPAPGGDARAAARDEPPEGRPPARGGGDVSLCGAPQVRRCARAPRRDAPRPGSRSRGDDALRGDHEDLQRSGVHGRARRAVPRARSRRRGRRAARRATARYEELLAKYPEAMAWHAAEFFAGRRYDPARAPRCSRGSVELRPNAESLRCARTRGARRG